MSKMMQLASSFHQIQLQMLYSIHMLFLGAITMPLQEVSSCNDISGSDMNFLEDSGIAYHTGISSPGENLHECMLIDLCMKTSLLLGQGAFWGT